MIANILIAVGFGCIGIAVGAMVLDRYHERQRMELEAMDTANMRKSMDTANQLAVVRVELARSEAMLDAVSRECAYLKAQRSRAESLHAERIREIIEAARWN